MKILYLKTNMHEKNNNALMNYKNVDYHIIQNPNILDRIDLSQFNCVYSPAIPINVSKYPNTKFLFGPHFSVFPEKIQMNIILGKNVIYTQPSDWARDVWRDSHLCNNIRIETLPFGVDTNRFNQILPSEQRNLVFVYYKSRKPEEFEKIMDFLSHFNVKIVVFNYLIKYSEEDYLKCLHNAKFGVWIGRHESQGFALEEALSCNVPLLVWNVKSMNQEYGYNYQDIPATCIPYWDNRCGEFFYSIDELPCVYDKFMNNLVNYKPREYILENISIEKCENKFIELINKI
jgi:hypothetical protein